MSQTGISRKEFIKNSSFAVAGLFAAPSILNAGQLPTNNEPFLEYEPTSLGESFTIKNVRLETGFQYDGEEIIATNTELFTIVIDKGKILDIRTNDPNTNAIDAKGLLLLPSFKDMHIHLDKTFYGGSWKAKSAQNRTVKDMIAFEQKMLPELLNTSTERAKKLIELLQSKGSNFARSHVNIEPTSGLKSLENLQKALEDKKDTFNSQLVAFPQHGVYYTESASIMRDAAQAGIDFIGGLDPNAVDGNIKRTIDFTVDLALEYKKGIDIHLHEGGQAGIDTIELLCKHVKEKPTLQGNTYLSHCFVLAQMEKNQLESLCEKLAESRIGIVSTIPFGRTIMPIPTLFKYGIEVLTGNDSIIDHWNTFGTGSVLHKANLMAQLYGYYTERGLSRSLGLATGNILPLDDKGNRTWPKVNDKADMVLVDASCSAEAVSRIAPVRSLIHNGNIVF